MAGSSGILNIAVSGLLASQRGLATAGHNISNVNTPGYSRQRVEIAASAPRGAGDGFTGTGVSVSTVRRILDGFLTRQVQTHTASLGSLSEFNRLASQVDNILADPLGGLSPAMQGFFDSLQELAADPASIPARQVVLSEADSLVQRFGALDQRFDDLRVGLDQRLRDMVAELNTIATGIANLNREIARTQGAFGGQPPNDLLDQRDELVRRLAELVSVSTVLQGDGALNVAIGSGQGIVTGGVAATLTTRPNQFDPQRLEIGFTAGASTALITGIINGGEMGGALSFRDQVLGVGQRALGQIAVGIARTFNDQHRLGVDLDGLPGGDFFNALDVQAPAVFPSGGNTGSPAAVVGVAITDITALTQSEYLLRRTGATYTLTRLADSSVFTLSAFPAGPETADGLTLSLASGAIADGDQFLIRPTGRAARDITLAITGARAIATAAPVRSAAALTNAGSARIADPVVNSPNRPVTLTFTSPTTFDAVDDMTGAALATGLTYVPAGPADTISFNGFSVDIGGAPAAGDTFTIAETVTSAGAGNTGTGTISLATVSPPDPNLADPVTITFTTPSTFDVTGATTGAPTTGIPYASGGPISFNGWTVTLTGTAAAGDVFTIGPTTNGIGDNRNGLALAGLQTTTILDGGNSTYGDLYGQLVVNVGTSTRQSEINRDAQQALLAQIEQSRDSVSGVNLDEEAADLVRFQQSFQASARVIAVANELFQALIGAVAR